MGGSKLHLKVSKHFTSCIHQIGLGWLLLWVGLAVPIDFARALMLRYRFGWLGSDRVRSVHSEYVMPSFKIWTNPCCCHTQGLAWVGWNDNHAHVSPHKCGIDR